MLNGLKVLKENKMNERIKLLAEQAGFRSNPNIYDRNQSFDMEKFAELIVRECMSLITIEHTALDLPEYNLGILEGYRRGRESMNIYFGIGE